MRDLLLQVRRFARAAVGRDVGIRTDVRIGKRHLGTDYGGWVISPPHIVPDSVVYSFGVGEDVSFDLEMIDEFGVQIHAFDPTPRSMSWVARQNLPSAFHFHALGVASSDGFATFHRPCNPSFASYTMVASEGDPDEPVQVPVSSLKTILSRLGHEGIDILKLDVEGAEYDVLDDLIQSKIDVRQILVEFHHRFRSISPNRTITCVEELRQHGYAVFYVSPRGDDICFIRRDCL